jgi:hypothetical protein
MMTRRSFSGLAGLLFPLTAQTARSRRPRVAVVMNTYFPNSHADVFVGRLLQGYRLNGKTHMPRVDVASFYVDQFHVQDMAREQAEEFGVKIYPTVADALRLGGSKLAVDGVAVIGEHGDYPRTKRGNVMYPRYRYFREITEVFEKDGRVVPYLNDKYFAYEWEDARVMYDKIRAMKIPFQAGSTLPLTWRRPALEFSSGIDLEEALAVSFSDLEEHGYHAIELLQAMVEKRKGGETGVESVRCVEGDEVWRMGERGEWSKELLDAALKTRVMPVPPNRKDVPQAIQVRYRDGLKATILNLNDRSRDYLFAAREKGRKQPHASCFYIQHYVHNHWGFMVREFEDLVLRNRPSLPMERTLVSTGITLFGLESRVQNSKWIETPQLDVRYKA